MTKGESDQIRIAFFDINSNKDKTSMPKSGMENTRRLNKLFREHPERIAEIFLRASDHNST